MNKFFSKALKLIRKLKTWWHHSLYGYELLKEDNFTNTIRYYYPTVGPYYYRIKPKWWGKAIVWLANQKRFTTALLFLCALLTYIPTWAPVIPEKINSMISSFFNQTDKPEEKLISQEANAIRK